MSQCAKSAVCSWVTDVTINSERPAIDFSLYAIRFYFRALDPVCFPPGKAGNIFRGAFGHIFRHLACVPQCQNAKTCDRRETCPYARLFEPSSVGSGPSGLADWPRPFVLRATHLDGKAIAPGATFFLDLNLFDVQQSVMSYLALTFAQLAREGLGPGRGRVELTSVCLLTESGEIGSTFFEKGSMAAEEFIPPLRLNLTPAPENGTSLIHRLRLRFMTPTELKSGQQLASRPEFSILASRIRDRLSTLRELYGPGPLAVDFRTFGKQSKTVYLIDCNLTYVDLNRYSSRTGQTHSIGGFTGEVEYEGNLGLFMPFLHAAQWTGVGRQTVWGKGQIALIQSSI